SILSLTLHIFFFFSSRRRHTRWPRDWSSDVCSSDLDIKFMTGRTGRGDHFASERVAHLGLVGVVAHEFDVLDARTAGAVAETVVAVEIEVVTFLGPAGGTLPVQTDQHVVVKFAE